MALLARLKLDPSKLNILSIALYILCLPLNAFYLGDVGMPGWDLLLMGWVLLSLAHFSWVANPLLFLAWITFYDRDPKIAVKFSSAAFVFAVLFIFFFPMTVCVDGYFTRYGAGYWLWLASVNVAVLASVRNAKNKVAKE